MDFDPVDELVKSLNENLSSVAMFFYNKYSGKSIGVVWKPHTASPAKACYFEMLNKAC